MKLAVIRQSKTETAIEGELFVDEVRLCFTLENRLLAIPAGVYPVTLEYSPHFGRILPELHNVPGRSEILIHVANWAEKDLRGCIGVGRVRSRGFIGQSRKALDELFGILVKARNDHQTITIEVKDDGLE